LAPVSEKKSPIGVFAVVVEAPLRKFGQVDNQHKSPRAVGDFYVVTVHTVNDQLRPHATL